MASTAEIRDARDAAGQESLTSGTAVPHPVPPPAPPALHDGKWEQEGKVHGANTAGT